jgi:hypothetical protein
VDVDVLEEGKADAEEALVGMEAPEGRAVVEARGSQEETGVGEAQGA